MPHVPTNRENSSLLGLGIVGGIILLFITTTALVFGTVCRHLASLCKRLCAKRKKRRSTKRKAGKKLELEGKCGIGREDSLRTKPPGGAMVKHKFAIPKTKSEVLAQPTYSQRMKEYAAEEADEKEVRLVSMYYTDKALGQLDPEQYRHHQHSITVGLNRKLGDVSIIVRHITRSRKLQVIVVSGKNFPPQDYSGSLDTCVTLCLLPDREHRKQTAIHRRSVNPMYNESFEFSLYGEDVYSRSLLLMVFYYDQYSHSHAMGEVQVQLIDYDLSGETSIWCHLQEISAYAHKFGHTEVGDLLLSLCYTSKDQILTVAIMKVSNLSQSYCSSSHKIYAKASLKHKGQVLRKRKTNLRETGDRNTVFNEALLFHVSKSLVESCVLRVALSHYNVVGKSSTIGEVLFSPEEITGPAASHWSDMLSKLDKPTAMWHTMHGFTFLEQREVEKPQSPD